MHRRVTKSFNAKKIGVTVVALLLAVLLLALIFFAAKSGRPSFLEQKTYYFVCTDTSARENFLEANAEAIRRMGGAGVVYSYLGKSYLIAAVYEQQPDADEVLFKLKQSYPGAEILKLTCKRASLRQKNKIMSNPKTAKICEFSDSLTSKLLNLSLSFHSGSLSSSEAYRQVLGDKLELETKLKSYDPAGEFEQQISKYISFKLTVLEGFLSGFYQSTKKHSVLMELATNLCLISFEMNNNVINSKK